MAIRTANNQSLTEITALPSVITVGTRVLLATETASSSATLSFTSGIDSTYDEYVFKFINLHIQTDNRNLMMNMSIDGGDNYNVTKTTTQFATYHNEGDTATALEYRAGLDLAQSTADQNLSNGVGNDNDQSVSGEMHLYNPSSTTFVKHFTSTFQAVEQQDMSFNSFIAGYANTTSAVDAIVFKINSGNIDTGVIKMYGVT